MLASLVDTTALWKIVVAGVVGGVGVVMAFGFVLVGTSRLESMRGGSAGARTAYVLLIAIAAAFCLAALVVGVLAMTKK